MSLTLRVAGRYFDERKRVSMLTYTPDDIFGIAESLERNGVRFYQLAAERSARENIRLLFTQLAEMEEAHCQRFHALRTAPPVTADAENQLYLQAMADMHVFIMTDDAMTTFLRDASRDAVLDFAIAREKDSIVLYTMLQDFLSPSVGREALSQIIREELRHIHLLSDARGEEPQPSTARHSGGDYE